ncbi:WD repeat domain-containing protein [Pleurostoma richardsiae]|uniref:WD repeat domain-containing protein n=1 Tax=Pleurostoma richardsiae TaxID=41990 RepID=A0AA38SC34_9PEZI|nr:WD repeat domain-containing protein [Pleurostoma richardsiae]
MSNTSPSADGHGEEEGFLESMESSDVHGSDFEDEYGHPIFESTTEGSDTHDHDDEEDDEEESSDDDPDYHDEGDEDEEDDDEFHDAEEGNMELEVIFEEPGDGGNDEDDDELPRLAGLIGARAGAGFVTHRHLLALIRGQDLSEVLFHDLDDDGWSSRRRRRTPPDPNRFPKVPSEKGRELMESGKFGSTDRHIATQKKLARRILDRELGIGDRTSRQINQDAMAQSMIPTSDADMIIHYRNPVYCGQFSDDGNFFYSCVKDFKVRMYDTSNPYNWRHYKTVSYPFGQWALTDAHLSPDSKWLAYTSLQSHVCFAPTDPNDTGDPYTLDLGDMRGTGAAGWRNHVNFAIWSIRFSGDGRELIAGNNAQSIVVYDIESRRVLHNITGHDDDVNAVCFADVSSPHILYSGSDDATIKVWDRRSMGDGREAGAFVGHMEGITYIDSKGDGRYVLSNGKDQTAKLWDLRMAMSTTRFNELNPRQYTRNSDYDYRWEDYDEDSWRPHPNDNSLVTFRGHRVQRTLIRCHFSPPGSTNSRYVYSGSHDGKIYVWNMDATIAGTIDVRKATANTRPSYGSRSRAHHDEFGGWTTCVREAHWHPNAPIIVASSWNGYDMNFGTCTVHSYNEGPEDEAEPKMGLRVNDQLAYDPALYRL